ncbi:unnamed protein product, partial [Symbiodinium sp. KB8]
PGLQEVSEAFPQAVRRGGSYNGRDCVDFGALAEALRFGGHGIAAAELNKLANVAFAHKDGRVEESWDGSGWVGYAEAEAVLAAPRPEAPRSLADLVPKPCAASAGKAAPVTRRWGRAALAAAEQKGEGKCSCRASAILEVFTAMNQGILVSVALNARPLSADTLQGAKVFLPSLLTVPTFAVLAVNADGSDGWLKASTASFAHLRFLDRWCDNLGGAVRIGDDFNGYSAVLEV